MAAISAATAVAVAVSVAAPLPASGVDTTTSAFGVPEFEIVAIPPHVAIDAVRICGFACSMRVNAVGYSSYRAPLYELSTTPCLVCHTPVRIVDQDGPEIVGCPRMDDWPLVPSAISRCRLGVFAFLT